ncbi:hypothetical protein E3J79_03680, partial [Candidatus Dependentiae bacterium]
MNKSSCKILFLLLTLLLSPALLKASGGIWLNADKIPQTTGNALTPQITFDCSGNAIAVWGQDARARSSRYDASTGIWSDSTIISTTPGSIDTPQIAIDCSGNAIAVWEQSDRIWYSRYDAS